MQLHNIKPSHQKRPRKRIGRGGKRGTYSGRGVKGQRSRAGTRKMQPIVRELIKRYPKLKGYRFNPKKEIAVVALSSLDKNFKNGDEVTPSSLLEKGLIGKIRGGIPKVKILAQGEIKKKLTVKGCTFSEAARQKIEKAGGKTMK